MSFLTKIFVVLVAVFSILLVALTVPFVMNTETYKERFQSAQQQAQIAMANAANREQDLAAELGSRTSQIESLKNENARLAAQLNALSSQLQEAQTQAFQAKNQTADVRAELNRLSSALQQAAQVNQLLQEEVQQRRDQMLTLQTRNVELSEQNRGLTTQLDTLTRQVRLFQEQLADAQRQYEQLAAQAPRQGQQGQQDQQAAAPQPEAPIQGMITDVQPIGDETFVAINLGRRDQVQEGMQFIIHEGDRFLGNLVVTQVDETTAAGRVTLQQGQIQPNVQVVAGTF